MRPSAGSSRRRQARARRPRRRRATLDTEDKKCPCDAENYNGFQDDDGCPDDPDTDGDGLDGLARTAACSSPRTRTATSTRTAARRSTTTWIRSSTRTTRTATGKNCANDPEDPDGYEDADGCPEPDNDKDTVVDLEDQCPNEPGVVGGDKPGCPKKPSLVIVTEKEIKITQQIHFEFDKDKIRPESFPILDAVVEVLQQNPKIKIEIQGHTDNKGAAAYNKKLVGSARGLGEASTWWPRASMRARLTSKGYGMEQPSCRTYVRPEPRPQPARAVRPHGGWAAAVSGPLGRPRRSPRTSPARRRATGAPSSRVALRSSERAVMSHTASARIR